MHDKNFMAPDLKLEAFVFAPMIWRHYLFIVHIYFFIDNKILFYVFIKNELNLHQRRWLEFLKDTDMSLHYHPGRANVLDDSIKHIIYCYCK